jgi:hypothetical protein
VICCSEGWGLFRAGHELANRSRSDPRTLTRAARDYAVEQPKFALAAGMTALRGIASGWGHEMTGEDVLAAYAAVMEAARVAGVSKESVVAEVRELVAANGKGGAFVGRALGRLLRA